MLEMELKLNILELFFLSICIYSTTVFVIRNTESTKNIERKNVYNRHIPSVMLLDGLKTIDAVLTRFAVAAKINYYPRHGSLSNIFFRFQVLVISLTTSAT